MSQRIGAVSVVPLPHLGKIFTSNGCHDRCLRLSIRYLLRPISKCHNAVVKEKSMILFFFALDPNRRLFKYLISHRHGHCAEAVVSSDSFRKYIVFEALRKIREKSRRKADTGCKFKLIRIKDKYNIRHFPPRRGGGHCNRSREPGASFGLSTSFKQHDSGIPRAVQSQPCGIYDSNLLVALYKSPLPHSGVRYNSSVRQVNVLARNIDFFVQVLRQRACPDPA